MTAHTFFTTLNTSKKRFSRWLFITGGLFLVITQGNNYLQSYNELYLGGLAVGLWMLGQGLFFRYFMRKVELTFDEHLIQYFHTQTWFQAEKCHAYYWKDIREIILSNYSIRLHLTNGSSVRLKLPNYTRRQFLRMKSHLKRFSEANEATFSTVRWGKKMKRLQIPGADKKNAKAAN